MFAFLFIMNTICAAINLSSNTLFGLVVGIANVVCAGLMLYCMIDMKKTLEEL